MEEIMANSVTVSKLIENYDLKLCNPGIDTDKVKIMVPDVNRPSLAWVGYFEYFDRQRIQVIGFMEHSFIKQMNRDDRLNIYDKLMAMQFPCMVYCRGMEPDQDILDAATKYGVPVMITDKATSSFTAEIIRWLNVQLAPRISIHGVLVDVYGEGVLIMGESGIGKSEAAIELIKRGHRLVADDVVELRKVSDETLVGTASEITRHLIELRGIGIIDVKALFGVESVKETQNIDMVIKLEEWNRNKEYDRMGLTEEYTEFLGNKIVTYAIPIRPGRNLAVIVEAASVNHRQKKMGYNAAQELYKRVQENFGKPRED